MTLWWLFKFDEFSENYSGEVLTTLGILGCFISLCIAMSGFDKANINQGIPRIIESLKDSFFVSVLGILGALIMKIKARFSKEKLLKMEFTNENSLNEKILTILKESSQVSIKTSEYMQNLVHQLTGSHEGSLLTEIKNMRVSAATNTEALILETKEMKNITAENLIILNDGFKKFSEHIVENNQKAFIEALKAAINDFNSKITEQFGENFKHLNEAVGKLLTWQEQYKESIEAITVNQEKSANSLMEAVKSTEDMKQNIKQISTDFTNVLENSKEFKNVSASLGENIEIAKEQIMAIKREDETLKQVVDNMTKFMPQVNKQVEDMMNHLKGGGDLLKKSLEEELNRSLATLGQQLTSLSNKFVEDYTPLTDNLREIVEISRKVNKAA